MGINRIFEGLSKVLDSGKQERMQPKTVTPTFVPTTETNAEQKRFEQQNYADYRRNQIQAQWTEQIQGSGKQSAQTQTIEYKPMYDGVKTTAELNQKLLETIKAVDPQPTGIKPHKLKSGKMSPGGVEASESAAKIHATRMPAHDLKAKLERLGEKYSLPPALIAGIASRESDMGRSTRQTGTLAGWGDPDKGGELHGFGIIQVDKYKAPVPGLPKILQEAYGKRKLDQYAEEHIEWGVQSFLIKLENVRSSNPKLSEANQIATALSKYNGGYRDNKVVYPQNDVRTTGHDYANDTLARTRWFANNWDKLK
jgi:hypothetical protein